jgi:hypothetical protein
MNWRPGAPPDPYPPGVHPTRPAVHSQPRLQGPNPGKRTGRNVAEGHRHVKKDPGRVAPGACTEVA